MSYRLLDRQPKKRGFGVIETSVAIFLVLILVGVGILFGQPIANSFYSLQRMIFMQDGAVVSQVAENALVMSLQSENNQLRGLLGRSADKKNMTLSAVLVRPPQTPYDSIVIDAGSGMGLKVGDTIYAEMNFAIGKVVEVSERTATVTLFSSAGQKASVLIGSSTTAVLVEGRGGGNFYIKLPRNIEIAVGDPVVWPDIQTILLGSVDVVDLGSGDAFANVYFRSPININTLRYVQFKSDHN